MENPLSELLTRPINNVVALPDSTGPVFTDYAGEKQDFFRVENLDLSSQYGTVKNKKGIFVEERCINVVSPAYEVHQPVDVYNTFCNVAAKTNLDIKRVLTNPHNGGLMISAKFDGLKILGDDHDINLTFYTSHCGTYKTFITLDGIRIPCMNQAPLLYKNKSRFIFSEKHYRNALDLDLIEGALQFIPESVEAYNEKAEIMQGTKFSWADFKDLYIEHYKLDTEAKRFQSKIDKARAIYNRAPGQESIAETSWKAYQAVTYINTHEGKETALQNERVILQGSNDSLSFMDELLAIA